MQQGKRVSMRRVAGAAMLAAALVSGTSGVQAQEREARSFAKDGPWTLDAGDDYCRLVAHFTNGTDQISFALERIEPSVSGRLIFIGDAIRPFRRAQTIGYAFLPSGTHEQHPYIRSESPAGESFISLGNVVLPLALGPTRPATLPIEGRAPASPPYDRAAELTASAAVDGLLLDEGLQEPIRLQTGRMRAPIAALQACTDDLLRVWGLDYAAHQTMTRRAEPATLPGSWVPEDIWTNDDYQQFSGDRNMLRIMVDAGGRPAGCRVHRASLSENTNAAICGAIMANGSFEPALDAQGHPMASYWTAPPYTFIQHIRVQVQQ